MFIFPSFLFYLNITIIIFLPISFLFILPQSFIYVIYLFFVHHNFHLFIIIFLHNLQYFVRASAAVTTSSYFFFSLIISRFNSRPLYLPLSLKHSCLLSRHASCSLLIIFFTHLIFPFSTVYHAAHHIVSANFEHLSSSREHSTFFYIILLLNLVSFPPASSFLETSYSRHLCPSYHHLPSLHRRKIPLLIMLSRPIPTLPGEKSLYHLSPSRLYLFHVPPNLSLSSFFTPASLSPLCATLTASVCIGWVAKMRPAERTVPWGSCRRRSRRRVSRRQAQEWSNTLTRWKPNGRKPKTAWLNLWRRGKNTR